MNSYNDELETVACACRPYRITDGRKFRLKDYDPGDTGRLEKADKPETQHALEHAIELLSGLQEKLYAQAQWGVLIVFQAMDAAGKDSCIKHVMSGINPQGCKVTSFKRPSSEELRHDFLWRCVRHLPERGQIGIFNRSYYEEVLVSKVHPEILEPQNLPPSVRSADFWPNRYEDIVNFERFLSRQGFVILKFFLHLSKGEQKKRFLKRLDVPAKNWKFEMSDIAERRRWDDYQTAYEEMIRATSSSFAPWHTIPADHKWFTRHIVAASILDAMKDLDLAFPELDSKARDELEKARDHLNNENA